MADSEPPAHPRDDSRAERPSDVRPDPGALSKLLDEFFRQYRESLDALFRPKPRR